MKFEVTKIKFIEHTYVVKAKSKLEALKKAKCGDPDSMEIDAQEIDDEWCDVEDIVISNI